MKINSGMQIRYGAVISYFAIAISIASALLYTPWMKNSIGDANYGLYTLVSSLISIFMMDFGLSTAVTRFVAKARAKNDKKAINDILGYVFKLYIIISLCIAVVLAIVYFFIEKIYTGLNFEEIRTFKKVYLIFATYSVFSFPFTPLSGILNANEKFIEIKLCDLFQKLFTIGLIIVALLLDYGVTALILMNAVSGICTIFLKLLIIKSNNLVRPNFKVKDSFLLKQLLSFSIWVTVLALAQRMIFNLAPTLLGIFSNSIEIARFAPASQLEGYFFTFAFAINGLFLPTIARYDYENRQEEFSKLMIKVGKYQISILGLLFVGIVILSSEFMTLWMGESYKISGYCTILLVFPSLLLYPQQIANTLISVRNKVMYQAIAALIIGVVNVILSIVLIPRYGVLGCSISICIAYFLNFILLNIIYKKQLELKLSRFYKEVYLRFLPLIALCIIVLSVVFKFLNANGWLGFALKVCVCCIVYVFIVLWFGFTKNEKIYILSKIKTKVNAVFKNLNH